MVLRYKVASFKVNTVLKVLAHDKVEVEKIRDVSNQSQSHPDLSCVLYPNQSLQTVKMYLYPIT